MAGSPDKSETGGGRWELAAHLVRERRLGLAMLGGGLLYFLIAALGWNPLPCPFLQLTGKPCPGCGMTRSCFAFLRGDFADVWRLNPFGPVFAVFWAVVGFGVALPQPWRGVFVGKLGRFEERTRWAAWFGGGLAIYGLTRWSGLW
ncbi:DUF2752 domain-containing protein [Akkermansiaceae bacterium]|nr:DUF2752 domain-containing protein [Akkermansiaceae bacterium]